MIEQTRRDMIKAAAISATAAAAGVTLPDSAAQAWLFRTVLGYSPIITNNERSRMIERLRNDERE